MPSYKQIVNRVAPGVEHHQNRYARALRDAVTPGCRWLDLGAGTKIHDGWVPPQQDQLASRASVLVGCDLVGEHLRRNPYLTSAVVADGQGLPFPTGSFDLVTANMVVEHLEDPQAAFDEVARVLAPGGRFVLVTPNRLNPAVFAASILLSRPTRKALARIVEDRAAQDIFYTFYRANTIWTLRRVARQSKLQWRRLEPFHSLPVASRFWPFVLAQAIWIKAVRHGPLRVLCDDIFGELEKPRATPAPH